MNDQRSDTIILGGGPAGLAQALMLAVHGLSSQVVDQADAAALGFSGGDTRVSAINSSSWKMLQAAGLTDALKDEACPVNAIKVNDRLAPVVLDFASDSDDEGDPLAFIVPNAVLRASLLARAHSEQLISLKLGAALGDLSRDEHSCGVTLSTGETLRAPLLIGADGRNSLARRDAGIAVTQWDYHRVAINLVINHTTSHGNIAVQVFHGDGPIAVLPLNDDADGSHRSAIVWTVAEKNASGYSKLGPRALAAEIASFTGGYLGEIKVAGQISSHPLRLQQAAQLTALRLALIGDAGHIIHPLAGQGLNLGLRDVAALTQCLVEGARAGIDLGDMQILDRYARWRRSDNQGMAMATDLLTRLFGLSGTAAARVRATGMRTLQIVGPAKAQIIAEARGTNGDIPQLLLGELV
ncbi:MAG: FAD-dependent monooxygenase [Parasphingorhabdus sp.]|nr:FAD-dependent monooxygenase [Parasphingorhabdus sp.]